MEELAAYLDVWSVVTRMHPALRTSRVFLSFRELLCLSHANPINAQGRVQRPKIESNIGHSDKHTNSRMPSRICQIFVSSALNFVFFCSDVLRLPPFIGADIYKHITQNVISDWFQRAQPMLHKNHHPFIL